MPSLPRLGGDRHPVPFALHLGQAAVPQRPEPDGVLRRLLQVLFNNPGPWALTCLRCNLLIFQGERYRPLVGGGGKNGLKGRVAAGPSFLFCLRLQVLIYGVP